MSEHKESLVKVLEYLVNDEQDKAADLLHNVFVEKAKNHWSSITEDDEVVEDEIQDEDLDETIDLDEADDDSEDGVEEAINVSDDEEDFLSDIETAEEEIDQEEIMDDEDMDDAAPEMDLAMDMEPEAEEGDEDEAGDAEEAMDNVEDAIAELRAAFADMMDDEPADDMDEPEMEESVEPMEEGATLSAVSVSHSDNSDKASPVAKGAGNAHAKPHPTDTTDGPKASAPAVKDMGVTGPQEAGKLSAAPSAKREDNKSDSPIRGMK
jgi:hypothetical protein